MLPSCHSPALLFPNTARSMRTLSACRPSRPSHQTGVVAGQTESEHVDDQDLREAGSAVSQDNAGSAVSQDNAGTTQGARHVWP